MINKWALEEFLPKLIAELNLSNNQIHFLERIGDYINRGSHILDSDYTRDYGYKNIFSASNQYVELIVRAMELKASKLDQELLDSFEGLRQFHIKMISPHICKAIQASNVVNMAFDNTTIGEKYICLHNDDEDNIAEKYVNFFKSFNDFLDDFL